jgi:tetratricopeptide (TPR) repeat protein
MNCKTLPEALAFIADEYGKAALRDGQRLVALLSDLAPELTKERNTLKSAFAIGLPQKLADASAKTGGEQKVAMNQCVSRLYSDYGVSKDLAEDVLWPYAEALGFEARPGQTANPKHSSQSPPHPKPKPAPYQPPPSTAQGYFKRGKQFFDQKKWSNSILEFSECLKFSPNYANAHYYRGRAFAENGDIDKVIADCTEAINLDSRNYDAYNCRGAAFAKKGNYDNAILDLDKMIDHYRYTLHDIKLSASNLNNLYNAYLCRGNVYVKKDDLFWAIIDYTKAIGINPKNAEAYNSRAHAYYKKGDFDNAISDFSEAIRLDPNYPINTTIYAKAYYKRAKTNGKRGDLKKARELGLGFFKRFLDDIGF